MGVDARMLVRAPGEVTDAQINEWGYRLHEAVHGEVFFVYEWEPPTYRTGRGCLTRCRDNSYEQDGEPVIGSKDETLIEVHFFGRYYGEGYERGNLANYIMAAEWLERNISGCTVHYGGDSSGVCAEPFDKEARDKLIQHWATVGHEPYFGFFTGSTPATGDCAPAPFWPVCPVYKVPMRRNGFGGNYAGFYSPAVSVCWQSGEWRTDNDFMDHSKRKPLTPDQVEQIKPEGA